jgi:hypothetical protein
MSQQWDEFSKSLAEESLPRRESLRRLGFALAGVVLSPFGLETALAGKQDPCKAYCRCRNKKQQNQCLAACRACGGDPARLCGSCGNYACCGNGQSCCDDPYWGPYCADLAGNVGHCGACGHDCRYDAGPYEAAACAEGECVYRCFDDTLRCDGTCTPVLWDRNNCGRCGTMCGGTTPYCNQGECSPCWPGSGLCGGICVSLDFDNANCGACGVVCPSYETCVGGYCQYTEPYWGDPTY